MRRFLFGAAMLLACVVHSSSASAAPGAEVYGALPDTTRAYVSPDAARVASADSAFRRGAEFCPERL